VRFGDRLASDSLFICFRVLAGLKFTRKQQPRLVNNVGRLCKWEHGELGDRRRDDEFNSFASFR
jgi:hypothetical protein